MEAPTDHPTEPRLSLSERVERWREYCLRLPVPIEIAPDLSRGFRAQTARADLGPVQALTLAVSSSEILRTPRLIRSSRTDLLNLDVVVDGSLTLWQGRDEVRLAPSELVVYDAAQPFRIRSTAGDGVVRGVLVSFPRPLLPLTDAQLDRWLGRPVSVREGPGSLLFGFLTGLMADPRRHESCNADHLGSAVIELLAASLTVRHDLDGTWEPAARQRALRLQVRGFILRHLGDPDLDPPTIAAAHHISVRYLHKLFQDDELKVADWIRQRRLEHCRRDLGDPAQLGRPVHAIATRWGFSSAAHFSRAFRAVYGLPPREYRALALRFRAAHAESTQGQGAPTTF